MPPVSPMLSKSVAAIPPDASYEPKWDGFRSICFRDAVEVELGSRNERPMTRYFPELVAAVTAELPDALRDRRRDRHRHRARPGFRGAATAHPPGRLARAMLAKQTPASFIAFDLLALGDEDYTERRSASAALRWSTRWPTPAPRSTSPCDHRSGDRTALVLRVRGRRPRRSGRQAADDHLSAGQTRHVQDQARAHRRLRRRRLPGAQVG